MVALSVMIEGQMGLTWPRWRRLVDTVDGAGFAGLFRSDHFISARPPDEESLELIVSLAYLADHSRRVHFGPLVAPISFRHPAMLARQAAALDDLSGGRMILGMGSGWMEREHRAFGIDLGDIPTRMARLAEGLEVVTRLLRSEAPVSFEGRFFQLRDAILLPRPARPGGPPILIGGNGPQRTLPLVARYADIWNALALTPDAFRERSATLDHLLQEAGRPPGAVRRTLMVNTLFGRDEAALARVIGRHARQMPDHAQDPVEEQLRIWRDERRAIVGTADAVVAQIEAYAAAGVEELVLQWFDPDDLDGLEALAEQVLPRLRA